MTIPLSDSIKKLKESNKLFTELFSHGTLSVELYRPVKVDNQSPHEKDELYVIASGSGEFMCDNKRTSFNPGDLLFVPAGVDHRFENFSDDFLTWVIFYGPNGGERTQK